LPARAANISGSLVLDDISGYYDGGQFTTLFISGTPQYSVNRFYSPLALSDNGGQTATGFETFCVETEVIFYPINSGGPSYNFTAGFSIQQADSYGYLTEGTAWLYEQFATGRLSRIDPNFSYSDPISAGSLQYAIWELEGEDSTPGSFDDPGDGQNLVCIAAWALGINVLAPVTSQSRFGVQILELTDTTDVIAQDQLIYTGAPVPDRGTAAVFLGISLLGLAAGFAISRSAFPGRRPMVQCPPA
jgi:hypothetical protein